MSYNAEERNTYFEKTIEKLAASNLVEGIIQLGSGVIGYNDNRSDIDLMVATAKEEDAEITKKLVYQTLNTYSPVYIKEKQFSKNIYLLIAILESKLEFNISIVPRDLLSVKSPLWKVIVDKSSLVTKKMKIENDRFIKDPEKYDVGFDVVFEFAYCAMGLEKEIARKNFIYALKLLEKMRDYTLLVQGTNEHKKLHQFKAFDTLKPEFINKYLSTYPDKINAEHLLNSAEKLKELFINIVNQSYNFTIEKDVLNLMNLSSKSASTSTLQS